MKILKKHKILFSIFVFAFGYLFWSFLKPKPLSPKDLEISEIEKIEKKEIHSSADILMDVDYLVYALKEGYVGGRAYPEEFQSLIDSLEALKQDKEIRSREDFLRKVSQIIGKFPDGHLNIINSPALACDEQSVEQASKESAVAYSLQYRMINGKKVLLAKISSFSIQDLKEQDELISSFKKKLKDSQAVIFDMRGNSGGVEELPLEMAAILWGETLRIGQTVQYYKMPIKSSSDVHTPVSFALHKNFQVIVQSRWGRYVASESHKGVIESILTYNEYGLDSTRKKITRPDYEFSSYVDLDDNTLTYSDDNYNSKGYKHPIIFLTDKYCASACERFLEALEEHPQFKHVGEHTAGAAQFGDVGYLELPISRAEIIIPSAFITYFDDRRPERKGYQPRYPISVKKDPLREISKFL